MEAGEVRQLLLNVLSLSADARVGTEENMPVGSSLARSRL
jgi:hypothetical protein